MTKMNWIDDGSSEEGYMQSLWKSAVTATTALSFIAASILSIPGCGREELENNYRNGKRDTVTVEMDYEDMEFKPEILYLDPGDRVRWVGKGHSTTAYSDRIPKKAEEWDSDILMEKGESYSREFNVKGVYDYYCSPHEAHGMTGTVVVGNSYSADQPGLEEPDRDIPEKAQENISKLNRRTK